MQKKTQRIDLCVFFLHIPVSDRIVRTVSFLFPAWFTVAIVDIVASGVSGIFIVRQKSTAVSRISRAAKTGKLLFIASCTAVPA